jgi:hypothetical protein
MGFRFRRSVRLIPGLRLNFTHRGMSASFGAKGFRHTIGSRGHHTSLGIPGTGLSYSMRHKRDQTPTSDPPAQTQTKINASFIRFIFVGGAIFGGLSLLGNGITTRTDPVNSKLTHVDDSVIGPQISNRSQKQAAQVFKSTSHVTPPIKPKPKVQKVTAPVKSKVNEANSRLMKLTNSERNEILSRYMSSSGEKCHQVNNNFYQGSENGLAQWSIMCSNGKSFAMIIYPDAKGSTGIIECSVLKAVNGGTCFTKYSD